MSSDDERLRVLLLRVFSQVRARTLEIMEDKNPPPRPPAPEWAAPFVKRNSMHPQGPCWEITYKPHWGSTEQAALRACGWVEDDYLGFAVPDGEWLDS